ncbi:MAG: AAA family ATPase [Acidimicrobiia bacterium]|nr:AAA family ATPase [Acidimicrobiia bacterium]
MDTLVGRDTELDAVLGAVHAGRAVAIHGPAGIGKTALWRTSIARLQEESRRVVRVVATETTRTIPLGAIAGVLAAADATTPPHERLVSALVDLRGDAGPPPVLAVDDAHLLDDHTAALVLAAASQDVAVVLLTARPEETACDAVRRFWKDDVARVIVLGVLTPEAAVALVETQVGAAVDARTHMQLHRASGGHPLALIELVDAGLHDGAFLDVGGVLAWRGDLRAGPALAELLHTRIDRLSEAERAVADLLAAAGPIPAGLAAEVAGSQGVDALLRSGMAQRSVAGDGLLDLAHPLYAQLLGDRMRPEDVRSLLSSLVAVSEQAGGDDPESRVRTAAWLVKLGDHSHPALLYTSARRAFDHGDVDLADHLAHAALQAGAGLPAELLLRRIDALLRGPSSEVVETSTPVAVYEDALARHDRFIVGAARADDVLPALDAALDRLDAPGLRDEVAALVLTVRAHAGDDIGEVIRDGSALAAVSTDPKAAVRLGLVLGQSLIAAGRTTEAVALLETHVPVAREAELVFLHEQLRSSLVHALVFDGQVEAADSLATSCYEEAVRNADVLGVIAVALPLGLVDLWVGRPRTALRRLGEVLALMGTYDVGGYTAYARAHIAWARAWLGEAERDGADDDLIRPAGYVGALLAGVTLVASAEAASLRGRLTESADFAYRAVTVTAGSGQRMLELLARHALCRVRPTKRQASTVARLARGCQGDLAPLLALSAAAIAGDDGGALEEAAARSLELGVVQLAHEHLMRAAAAHSRHGSSAGIRRCRSAVLDVDRGMEAVPGGPSGDGGAPVRLTTREREVAALAAAGGTNAEIAAALGTSVRTVHSHLQAVYRKLGMNRREELGVLLDLPPG